jgi:hypothetical protein
MLPDMGDAAADARALLVAEAALEYGTEDLGKLRREMEAAAEALEFERAALLRDRIRDLEAGEGVSGGATGASRPKAPSGDKKSPARRRRS